MKVWVARVVVNGTELETGNSYVGSVDLADVFYALPGQTINGQQTLGENISDLGGVKLAYDGLQRALERRPPGKIDNYTPEQRFFLSFATIWRNKTRNEALIDQLRTGSHSPERYRVLGPLANVPEFAHAFNCPAGAPMMRAASEQISIW